MKAFPHFIVIVITVMLVAGTQFSSVKAINYNPAAEEYIKHEILADGDADLAMAFENADERVISAEFIVALWQDPAFQAIPFFRLRNATIIGDIEAQEITIPFDIELHNCALRGGLNLAKTETKTFRIDDSLVDGPLEMGRMVVEGDLALYNSTFEGGVTLFGVEILDNLLARNSKFLSTKPAPVSAFPFELWTMQVGGITEFSDAVIQGEVKADEAIFGDDIRFDNVVFEKSASFRKIQVSTRTEFGNAVFKGDVDFESSVLGQDAVFTGSTFNGNASFDYIAVERFLDLDNTTFNQGFSFFYTTVGWPYFDGATFNGNVDFEGLQVSSDLDFSAVTYNNEDEPFILTLAQVNGLVRFDDFTSPAGLSLAYNQFGDLSISGDQVRFAFIMLDTVSIDGSFAAENITTHLFSVTQSSVKQLSIFSNITAESFYLADSALDGKVWLSDVKVESQLGLNDVTINKLILDGFTWPASSENFSLRGATYHEIEMNGQKISEQNYPDFYTLIRSSKYDAEVYKTFEQFLANEGLQDFIPEVELAKKQREREEFLEPYSVEWIWSWFLEIFAGYGQRPSRALLWSLLIIAIGALVYRKESDLVRLHSPEETPPYNAILYSFTLFLPFIDLGIADKWNPKPGRKGAWMYKHVHKMLGWILTPIAILTFGGFIQ